MRLPVLFAISGFFGLCGLALPCASADESGVDQNDPVLFQRVAKQLDQDGKYFLYQDKTELKREFFLVPSD